jgi:hypothetical protein
MDEHVPHVPAPLSALLWESLPALGTTALLTFALVWHAVGESVPVVRTIVFGAILGGLNGCCFFFLHGLVELDLAGAFVGTLAGIPALVVSGPLGFGFGIVLSPFVALASRALERPSHAAHAHVVGLGAVGLVVTGVLTVIAGAVADVEPTISLACGAALAGVPRPRTRDTEAPRGRHPRGASRADHAADRGGEDRSRARDARRSRRDRAPCGRRPARPRRSARPDVP